MTFRESLEDEVAHQSYGHVSGQDILTPQTLAQAAREALDAGDHNLIVTIADYAFFAAQSGSISEETRAYAQLHGCITFPEGQPAAGHELDFNV